MEVDPLHLSLDEIISLNKLRNQEDESLSLDTSSLASAEVEDNSMEDNGSVLVPEKQQTTRLVGPRSVHERIGWVRKNRSDNQIRKSNNQDWAIRAIRNARNLKRKQTFNPVQINSTPLRTVRNYNALMRPPLTTKVLKRFDQNNGNFFVKRRTNGSVFSATASTKSSYRHSTKGALNLELQEHMKVLAQPPLSLLFEKERRSITFDLENFRPKCQSTSVPVNVRFSMYD